MHGASIKASLSDPAAPNARVTQYYEMLGHRAIWHDGWKAVAYHERDSDFEKDQWELYNLTQDISESHNLAAEMPGKLAEMQQRWWTEAGKYNVLPLDDRQGRSVMPGSIRDRKVFTYYPDLHLLSGIAPPINGRSHRITADVERADNRAEGVLMAHGNVGGGYTLYVKDNRLIYEYNFVGQAHYFVTSTMDVPTGASSLSVEFTMDGKDAARATLFINGAKAGEGAIPHLMLVTPAVEGADIGRDGMSPVSGAYKSREFPFTGKLHKVVVELQ
jgi:hypothetical protein